MYRRYGFVDAGLRKAYYPAAPGQPASAREDAVVMSLRLGEETP